MSQTPGDDERHYTWPPPISAAALTTAESPLRREVVALRIRATAAIAFDWIQLGFQCVLLVLAVIVILAAVRYDGTDVQSTYATFRRLLYCEYPFYITQVVVVTRWTYLAFKNLNLFQGTSVGMAPMLSTALLMLPVINLIWSYQLNSDLYRYSSPPSSTADSGRRRPLIVAYLYAGTFLSTVLSFAVNVYLRDVRSWTGILKRFEGITCLNIVAIISLALIIAFTRQVTSLQESVAIDLSSRQTDQAR